MRDKRFVAEHRGGPLTKEHHQKLMRWARTCAEHVLSLFSQNTDERIVHALYIAEEWENNNVPTGEAMKASVKAHAAAREATNPIDTAIARSVGHAVATAHMADHSLGAALYGLKAVKLAGESIDEERKWQISQLQTLPPEIVDLVLTNFDVKSKSFKL